MPSKFTGLGCGFGHYQLRPNFDRHDDPTTSSTASESVNGGSHQFHAGMNNTYPEQMVKRA